MTQSIVGIDVSKLTLDIALLHESKVKYLKIKNNSSGFQRLHNWLLKHDCQQTHVCLEATGQYGFAVAGYLYAHGFQVSVVNPARIKAYAASRLKRNKTDKADALLIAEFCQKENPPLWSPPRPAFSALKDLVHQLDDFMACKQQIRNRQEFQSDVSLVNTNLQELIDFLDLKIEELKAAIHDLIQQDAQLNHQQALLVSIPGIGDLTAAKLLAEVRDFLDFDNSRQLTAYAGLNPRQYQSGSSVHRKSRLSKTGNASLRRSLYMPAIVAMRHNPVIQEFAQRLLDNRKPKMAVVGACMRKLLVLAYGVIKSDTPFDPHFAQESAVCP
jgi:transposase